MQDVKILNSKEKREILDAIKSQWDADWKPDHALARNSQDKYMLITRDLGGVDWERLRISSVGMYVAEMHDGRVRLSVEGSQLVGPLAKRNVVTIGRGTLMEWMKGRDIEVEGSFEGHVIVRCGDLFAGTGAFKEGTILNHVPKSRRLPENA